MAFVTTSTTNGTLPPGGIVNSSSSSLTSSTFATTIARSSSFPASGFSHRAFVATQPSFPFRVSKIYYNILGRNEINRLSVLPCRRVLRPQKQYGVNDPKLGVCERGLTCVTCGLSQIDCVGHPGHIDLTVPVFHLGYFSAVVRICRTVCKKCSYVLLADIEKAYYRQKMNAIKVMDPLIRIALTKSIQEDAYKTRICYHCNSVNGTVRRLKPMRIIHEKYLINLRMTEYSDDGIDALTDLLKNAAELNPDIAYGQQFAQEVLDPVRVRALFQAIPLEDVCLLGLDAGVNPADLVSTSILVPPVGTRPSGPTQTGTGTREDELTIQYNDILCSVDAIRDVSALDPPKLQEQWDLLQMKAARLLDSALPGFPVTVKTDCKSFAQRMKGKHGRFRGNLSGKRVDFSGRSVISPDPNLKIDEIAIPLRIARILTYPQRVFEHNIEQMRQMVRNGPDYHPGAITVIFVRENACKGLLNQRDRDAYAEKLSIGDIVERHMINGDLVLFNRQPSLHRISMMCHKARVLPYRTLRFNECCCSPYNADFDGDEMNIHLVQTEEARAEALTLMLTDNNIVTAKNGEPIIACTQDFLTAAYLLTSRDTFFDRSAVSQCVAHFLRGNERFELPYPAIMKPVELWTGKQLFDILINPDVHPQGHALYSSVVNLDLMAFTKFYSGNDKEQCKNEGFVHIHKGKLISGRLDKKLLGGGAKDGLFARLCANAGGPYAAKVMSRIAQLTSRYLMNYGFSLGLGDVAPTERLQASKTKVLSESFAVCREFIALAKIRKLEPLPGMTIAKTLEAKLNEELSKVRETCGNAAVNDLTPSNASLVMAQSGSKGSTLNIAQMIACVGQQTVNGKRIRNAFIDRTLPHYERFAEDPDARGFVSNSFYSSLKPTEFFFHTMAGREGLVDTAVKTAETGYIYRRLMKAMEDLSIKYDGTVRNSKGDIIQLVFGEDALDPQLMEGGSGFPVNLNATWLSVLSTMVTGRERMEPSLLPGVVEEYVKEVLVGWPAFRKCSYKFKHDIMQFWEGKTKEQRALRARLRLRNDVTGMFMDQDEQPHEEKNLEKGSNTNTPEKRRTSKRTAGNSTSKKQRIYHHNPSPVLLSQPEKETTDDENIMSTENNIKEKDINALEMERWATEIIPLTKNVVSAALRECVKKYQRKICEPGTPCGAIAAQSVGEPSTQMTLRTFHFAGVASMSITQGVPRLVEIINANKNIATPIVKTPLLNSDSLLYAVYVKAQMEKVQLKEVAESITEMISSNSVYLHIKLNTRLIADLHLDIDSAMVKEKILVVAGRPMSPLRRVTDKHIQILSRDSLKVTPPELDGTVGIFSSKQLLTLLPDVVVGGIPGVNRAILSRKRNNKSNKETCEIIAEGAELQAVMNLEGVDGKRAFCNHINVVEKVLGIEAARATIVSEIQGIMNAYSLSIDIRHIYLLADVMTHRGQVLGITRYGIQKMNSGVLTMASFERTTEHLYNAALYQRSDAKLSVSESIIVGAPIPLGSNSFSLYYDYPTTANTILRLNQQCGERGWGGISSARLAKSNARICELLEDSDSKKCDVIHEDSYNNSGSSLINDTREVFVPLSNAFNLF